MIDIKLLKRLISLLALMSFCYVYFRGNLWVSLLPLEFFVLYNFAVPNITVVGGGFSIMSVVLSMRYIVYPVVYANTGYCVEPTLFITAILLMLIEMGAIFATIRYFYTKKSVGTINYIYPQNKINPYVPVILVAVFGYFLLSGGEKKKKKHLIFNVVEAEEMMADDYKINNVLEKVIQWVQFFLTVVFVDYFYKKYKKSGYQKYYYFIFTVLFMNCIYFSGDSRLSLLIPTMTVVAMLYKIFRGKSKEAVILTVSIIGLVIVSLSIVKFFGAESLAADSSSYNLFSEFLLNAYFGGINNVIYGLKTYEKYGTDVGLFFVDSVKGMMVVSKYFANSLGTPNYFNYVIHGLTARDQIIPTITQGLLYFGPFFCWIPSVIMTYFVCYADRKWARADDLQTSYCWAYVTIIVGWSVPGNMCHFFINFTNTLIPLLVLIKLNQMYGKNKKRINGKIHFPNTRIHFNR